MGDGRFTYAWEECLWGAGRCGCPSWAIAGRRLALIHARSADPVGPLQRHVAAGLTAKVRRVKINRADDFGQTALERASEKGDVEMMIFLMDHGADYNFIPPKSEFGGENRTPLIASADGGHVLAVELLIARGAKVNGGIGEYRRTALAAAVSNEYIAIVRLLLSKGADQTIRNWDGWTMLQIARERKNQAIIDLLTGAKAAK